MKLQLLGQKFGRLTVIGDAGSKSGKRYWRCRCECGGTKSVITAKLRNGHTQSCGCLQRESISAIGKITGVINGKAKRIHGQSPGPNGKASTPEYRSWCAMRRRCNNSGSDQYEWYGARGITVCDRWDNFESFLEDMGKRPKGCTLDRIDNNAGYSPENCRWATHKEQCQNRRPRSTKRAA